MAARQPIKHVKQYIPTDSDVTFVPNHHGLSDSIVCNHEIVRTIVSQRFQQLYPPCDGISYEDCIKLGEGEIVFFVRLPKVAFPVCPMVLNELPVGFVRKYGYFMGLSRQLLGLSCPEEVVKISSMRQGVFQTVNLVLDTIYFGQFVRLGEQPVNKADLSPIVVNESRNTSRILACFEPVIRSVSHAQTVSVPKVFQLLDHIYSPWTNNPTRLPEHESTLMWHLFVVSVKKRIPEITEDILLEFSTWKRCSVFFVRPQFRRYYSPDESMEDLFSSQSGINQEYGLNYFSTASVEQCLNAFAFWNHYLMFHFMKDASPEEARNASEPFSAIQLDQIGNISMELCNQIPSLAVALDIGHEPMPGSETVLGRAPAESVQLTESSLQPANAFFEDCNDSLGNRDTSSWQICGRAITWRARPGHGIGIQVI